MTARVDAIKARIAALHASRKSVRNDPKETPGSPCDGWYQMMRIGDEIEELRAELARAEAAP